MLLKALFRLLLPGNILDPFNIFGRRKEPQSTQSHQPQQPGLAPGSAVPRPQTPGGSIPNKGEDLFWTSGKPPVTGDASNSQLSSPPINGASQLTKPNNNVDGVVPPAGTSNGVSSVDGSISKGDAIIHIPSKPDGTTRGTKHRMKPITEIEEGPNVTNGQYPGGYVQSPPGQRPDPADPSQFPGNLPDAKMQYEGHIGKLPQNISQSLTRLSFSGSKLKEDPIGKLEKLPNLWVLELRNNAYLGKHMICSSSGMPRLKCLRLSNLQNLEMLTVEKGGMPKLCTLLIENCQRLVKLPEAVELPCKSLRTESFMDAPYS